MCIRDSPHSGIYEAETARTLDGNGGNPSCNQGVIAVVAFTQNQRCLLYTSLDESEVTTANILTRLLRRSQITGGHLTDDDGVVNTVSRAKLDALSDIIDSAMAEEMCIRDSTNGMYKFNE